MHSMIRCSIPMIWGYGFRCDFILEPLFSDRINEINYCVVYTIDPERNDKVARYLIDVPLHADNELRVAYETWKKEEQLDFTGTGGRRSRGRRRLDPIAARLAEIADEEGEEPRTYGGLRATLFFSKELKGDHLTKDEQILVCQKAFKLFWKDRVKKGKGDRQGDIRYWYTGQTADLREAVFLRCLERGALADDVAMCKRFVLSAHSKSKGEGGESQTDIAADYGITQNTVSGRVGVIRKKFLGYAFEDVYASILRKENPDMNVILGGSNTDAPDIIVTDQEGNPIAVYSVKCYLDRRSTVSIGMTEISRQELELKAQGVPLYLVYYDIVADKLFDPIRIEDQIVFTFRKRGTSHRGR